MNRYVLAVFVLILTCCLYSCSFRKLVAGKKPEVYVWHNPDSNANVKPVTGVPVPDSMILAKNDSIAKAKKLADDLVPIWTTRLQYRTFSGKAKMHMEAPEDKQDFTAHIRIRKDSVIWINITAFGGISFARVLVTRDSFFMLNHIQKTAVCVPLSKAARILPSRIDFSSLQNLIIGEPLRDGNIINAASAGNTWILHVEDTGYIQEITYDKADSTMSFAQLLTHMPNGPKTITRYNQYEIADGRRMSTGRILHLQNSNDFYTLEMNFTKVNFDENLEYPFSIPKNYIINPPQE